MANFIKETDLAVDLTPFTATEAAYTLELANTHQALMRNLSTMVECDKELTPYYYKCIRDRLSKSDRKCVYLDGRTPPADAGPMGPQGIIATMISQIRNTVRGSVEARVVVLPHLDLLTTASGGITADAREVVALMYENPEITWLGFKDPSFPLPQTIQNVFPHKESIMGIHRERLQYLITQKEARKFGDGFNPYLLYKHVSGVNAVRLRRMLSTLEGEDYPADSKHALRQLRQATVAGSLTLPDLDLYKDIGGYQKVKDQLQKEILDVLSARDSNTDPEAVKQIESLLPRGMIFYGPPGTGKTFFAKAIATSLGAAVTVVSGPELKSRWVGESEENLRRVFVQARQSAPAIIIFDELDSFASARGTFTGSGVEHSMVNQLLTEMDGFRKEELVFVVGTTNLPDMLDPALLRPGRFEFKLHIPYPNKDDRKEIFKIYNKKLGLQMDETVLDAAAMKTSDLVGDMHTPHSGDHIQAICRGLARDRLRKSEKTASTPADIDAAMNKYVDYPELTKSEESVIAVHECGHAIVAMHCPNIPPIDRIQIGNDNTSLGFVRYSDSAHKYVTTRATLLDQICTLFGGREAEDLFCNDISLGATHDIDRATSIAKDLVMQFGMGGEKIGAQVFVDHEGETCKMSDSQHEAIEKEVREILDVQQERARQILKQNRGMVVALKELLIEKKTLDRKGFSHLTK